MFQKLAERKKTIIVLMIAILAAAGVFFVKTTAFGFYAALKICIAALALTALYLVITRGIRRILGWMREHRRRLVHLVLLEAVLFFYMYFFVHKIKNVITLYQSAQMTFGFLVMMLIAVAAVVTESGRIPLHRLYLLLGVSFGVMFLYMQPVGSIPDEKAHLYATYDVSNSMLGVGRTPKGSVIMRAEDAVYPYRQDSDAGQFTEYWESIDDPAEYENLIGVGRKPLDTQRYQYILPAVGVTIGRLLHMSAAGVFFLGRLFNMLGFVLVTAYAIRCLPFGKNILMLVALMPMTLQQASAFSYDAFLNALGFLIVAMTIRLTYGEEGERDAGAEAGAGMSRRQHIFCLIVLAAACILILPVKRYAYAALCFLPLLYVKKKWKTDRKGAIFILAVLLGCVAVFGVTTVLPEFQNTGVTAPSAVSASGKQRYSLEYLLSKPYEWVYVLLNTSRNRGAFYIESMIGSPMGVLSKIINTTIIYCYVVLLVLASLKRKGETIVPGRAAKIWINLMAWGSVACIMAGMLFAYTDITHQRIDGVQGRYFIPIVFPMLLTVRSDKIVADRSLDGPLLSGALTCLFFMVHFLIS